MNHRDTEAQPNLEELNLITGKILHSAIEVHKNLGPGLLESVYEVCLAKELMTQGLNVKRQLALPVTYKGENLNLDFRIDLLVEDQIIVELKAADSIVPVFEAQVLTYLKLSEKRIGLLINFNVPLLEDGFKDLLMDINSVSQ